MKLGIWEFNTQTIIIAIVTLACLLVIVNQAASLVYKVQLLSGPCNLCVSLNPEWKRCYKEITRTFDTTNITETIKNKNETNYDFSGLVAKP